MQGNKECVHQSAANCQVVSSDEGEDDQVLDCTGARDGRQGIQRRGSFVFMGKASCLGPFVTFFAVHSIEGCSLHLQCIIHG